MLRSRTSSAVSLALAACGLAPLASPAYAGPPFSTDDAAPVDAGALELIGFWQRTALATDEETTSGLDVTYGVTRDLQLTAVIPHHRISSGDRGFGDVEVGAKYRIIAEGATGHAPDIALAGTLRLPTADTGWGAGKLGGSVGIWTHKRLTNWSLFGGGNYVFNPGSGNRDYVMAGAGLTRRLSNQLTVGVEIYHQTPGIREGLATARVALGGTVALSDRVTLMGSYARGLYRPAQTGRHAVYLGVMVVP